MKHFIMIGIKINSPLNNRQRKKWNGSSTSGGPGATYAPGPAAGFFDKLKAATHEKWFISVVAVGP